MHHKDTFQEGSILFVWNAGEGWHQAVRDTLHKWLDPKTYPCRLCQLTYGPFGPREQWSRFVERCDRPLHFFHRETFKASPASRQFPGMALPAVLEFRQGRWAILMGPREINQMGSLEALLARLEQVL
ncbi:hypothetical protein [Robiginitalea marina]|uniref:GTPase n=1 Tax=Robiginitalea marina TaxID=2954105 RepID=A0ABT1AXI0_9FLAO|nr:hypothetical protein [Robiginitalea marina]MCO5724759.1 hypothetical protein [Robiginitalea marina]